MRRRVLLIEDDDRVRRVLRLSLEQEDWVVDEAATGRAGVERLDAVPPDVVLLDLMLPDEDGFALCRQIRRVSDVPVIMVTARTDSHDVVAGLEAGADDYVTKPLVAKELSARIRALLRRYNGPPDAADRVELGDLVVDVAAAQVSRAGEPVRLTRTEFRLLCELAQANGAVRSREQLLERVWGYDYFGDSRIVDVHIRRLRTRVEADPSHPTRVITVRGLGHRLVA